MADTGDESREEEQVGAATGFGVNSGGLVVAARLGVGDGGRLVERRGGGEERRAIFFISIIVFHKTKRKIIELLTLRLKIIHT
jgi:hypothetical protein